MDTPGRYKEAPVKIHVGLFYRFDTRGPVSASIYKQLGRNTPEVMSFIDVLAIGFLGCGVVYLYTQDKSE